MYHQGPEPKEFEVWLGVKLRTGADSAPEAAARAVEWLAEVLRDGNPDGVHVLSRPVDLVEPVVRALQQMAEEERRRQEEAHVAAAT